MKRVLSLVVLLLLTACRSTSPSIPGDESRALERRTFDFYNAVMLRDAGKLRTMIVDEYQLNFIDPSVYGTALLNFNAFPGGIPRGRQPWLIELLAKLELDAPISWSILHARVYDHVGVTVSWYEWSGKLDGVPFSSRGYVTDIWVQKDKEWYLVMSNADVLPRH